MSIDKAFTDKLIKRLYQVEPNESLDLTVVRSELEHIIRQSRIDTLDWVRDILDKNRASTVSDIIKFVIDDELEKAK